MKAPVTVLIVTKNAAATLARTLDSLHDFSQLVVIDSNSTDGTQDIATARNIPLVNFSWNGLYPKKRQWCLQHLNIKHDWVLFVDADEVMTPKLSREIREAVAAPKNAAYFIYGQPRFSGKFLRFGRWNNKIVLFDRYAAYYPEMADIAFTGMGEVEGHYQPVIQGGIGQLRQPLKHFCADNLIAWLRKHRRYAAWQAKIEQNGINLAATESGLRYWLKYFFQRAPFRPHVAFADSFFLKLGFLDGGAGFDYAAAWFWYYRIISLQKRAGASKDLEISGA